MAHSWLGTASALLSGAAALRWRRSHGAARRPRCIDHALQRAARAGRQHAREGLRESKRGISVKIRTGEGPALAAQLVAEGTATPADVYFTENSPELMLLEEKGLLAQGGCSRRSPTVPARFNSPSGAWVGVTARENVLAYNTNKIKPAQLPQSLFDLAKPEWKGKVGIAPSDGDFLPLVSAVIALKGEAADARNGSRA